jgi:hypothetical protein
MLVIALAGVAAIPALLSLGLFSALRLWQWHRTRLARNDETR